MLCHMLVLSSVTLHRPQTGSEASYPMLGTLYWRCRKVSHGSTLSTSPLSCVSHRHLISTCVRGSMLAMLCTRGGVEHCRGWRRKRRYLKHLRLCFVQYSCFLTSVHHFNLLKPSGNFTYNEVYLFIYLIRIFSHRWQRTSQMIHNPTNPQISTINIIWNPYNNLTRL
jgi:hypothetical protein